jgi:hypothetical protein
MAHAVVHELQKRMQPGLALPIFSSDSLRLCFYALTAHFGCWISPDGGRKRLWQLAADFIYGQVKKLQRRRRLVKVERVMLCGSFEVLANRLKAAGLSGRLNTAFVERLNLTLRQGVALLTRRTWGTAQQASELAVHIQWWRAAARTTLRGTMKLSKLSAWRLNRVKGSRLPGKIVLELPRHWHRACAQCQRRCGSRPCLAAMDGS